MLIRKLFAFEASHIVRNCSSERCRTSMHGHSFRVELFLESSVLDRGQMVYDFGLMKGPLRELFDSFDHAFLFWREESAEFQRAVKHLSRRWVSLPVSPTAEQLSRVLFLIADAVLRNVPKTNGEKGVHVHSVILHETATGYARCFRRDAFSRAMGAIRLKDIEFSDAVRRDWSDSGLWDKIL
jgi:6-pyruvoyltetrahydropterin/6-carboxytetrahydropterin synthase